MKGLKLNINICILLAFALGLVMAVLGIYESWSQHAGNAEDPMLYATLVFISFAFLMSSFAHPERYREITKVKGVSLRLEHFHRMTAYFFGGVIAFSVNSSFGFIETLHLLFTGLSIASGYFAMILYSESRKSKILTLVGFVLGVGGFLAAFLFKAYSIAWGEVIAAAPLAAWMYVTLNKK